MLEAGTLDPTKVTHLAVVALSRAVDKSIRRSSSIDDMKAEELRYWQAVSARERMQAGCG